MTTRIAHQAHEIHVFYYISSSNYNRTNNDNTKDTQPTPASHDNLNENRRVLFRFICSYENNLNSRHERSHQLSLFPKQKLKATQKHIYIIVVISN
jgi:hypothetical protein